MNYSINILLEKTKDLEINVRTCIVDYYFTAKLNFNTLEFLTSLRDGIKYENLVKILVFAKLMKNEKAAAEQTLGINFPEYNGEIQQIMNQVSEAINDDKPLVLDNNVRKTILQAELNGYIYQIKYLYMLETLVEKNMITPEEFVKLHFEIIDFKSDVPQHEKQKIQQLLITFLKDTSYKK